MPTERKFGVCLLVTDIDAATGGVPMQSRRLLTALHQRGIATYVCTRNYHRKARNSVEQGTRFHRSAVISRKLGPLNSVFYLLDCLWWLCSHRHQYHIAHCQQMFGSAMAGLIAKKITGKPVIVRVTSTGSLGEVYHVQQMAFAKTRLKLLRNVDGWVALTQDMKREIETLGVPSEKISVIPNSALLPQHVACDAETRAQHRAKLKLDYRQIAVFTGRLSSEKGLDVLLQSWKAIHDANPEAHLLLLGSGGDFRNVEAELRTQCDALHLNGVVHFLGHVDNVTDYLLAADLFVFPTRTEGMSNSLVEAMAAGSTIVTTDIPANRDLIVPEENGLLVPPDDDSALANAVLRVLNDSTLAERLGHGSRAKAERDLSVEAMTQRYIDLYESLLVGGRR